MVWVDLSSENLKQKAANFLEVFEKIRMTSRPHYNTRKNVLLPLLWSTFIENFFLFF